MKRRLAAKEILLLIAPCAILGALGLMWSGNNNEASRKLAVKSIEFQSPNAKEIQKGFNRKITFAMQLATPPEISDGKYVGGDFHLADAKFVWSSGTTSRVISGVKQSTTSTAPHPTVSFLFDDRKLPKGKLVLRANLYQTFAYNIYGGGKAIRSEWQYQFVPISIEIPNLKSSQVAK